MSNLALPRPLRVAHVFGSLSVGGLEAFVETLIPFLDRRRVRPEIICLNRGGHTAKALRAKDIPVHEIGLERYNTLWAIQPTCYALRACGPFDIVHCHMRVPSKLGRIAAYLAGIRGIITQYHGHRQTIPWRHKITEKFLNAFTDRHVAVSTSLAEAEILHQRLPRSKVLVIPNPIRVELFANARSGRWEALRHRVRAEWKIPGNAFLIGSVSRLIEGKDVATFIRALPACFQASEKIHGVVIGDGEQRPSLESLAQHLTIPRERLIWAGFRSDVPRILPALDAFVVSSKVPESFCIALLEAFAAGLPSVATNTGGMKDFVEPECNALTFSIGDHQELAQQLCRLFRDPTFARSLGAAARLCAQRYDVSRIAPLYEQLYLRLATEKRLLSTGPDPIPARH